MSDEETKALEKQRDGLAEMLFNQFHTGSSGMALTWEDITSSSATVWAAQLADAWRGVADLVVDMMKEARSVGREDAVNHMTSDKLVDELNQRSIEHGDHWVKMDGILPPTNLASGDSAVITTRWTITVD